MGNEKKLFAADLILTDALEDYAAKTHMKVEKIRDDMIASGACDALYDFDTELWVQGPDYFIDFFLKMMKEK